jgi:hypothetical protein
MYNVIICSDLTWEIDVKPWPFLALLAALPIFPAYAATYFVSTLGNDTSGDGSLARPWASCYHDVNAGDYILWEDGTYVISAVNGVRHVSGKGMAHCWAQHFGGAILHSSEAHGAFYVWNDNWSIQGFVMNDTNDTGSCVRLQPIVAGTLLSFDVSNNVCTGAHFGCVATSAFPGSGVDYVTIGNNICYDTARANGAVYTSAIDLDGLQDADISPGTHIRVFGNFLYGNKNTNTRLPHSDGEGIIVDRLDGSDTGLAAYTQKIVLEDNYIMANGGPGISIFHNPRAAIVIRNNFVWGNLTDRNYGTDYAAEILVSSSNHVTTTNNTILSGLVRCCTNNVSRNIYGYYDTASGAGSVANIENHNTIYTYSGQGCGISGRSCDASDRLHTPFAVAAPADMSPPDCRGYTTAESCIQMLLGRMKAPTALAH